MAAIAHLLQTLASFAVVLGVLVFIHEYGHYLAARICGIYVEVFSIGFGRTLASWTDRRGTVWKLALLPLGGFVRMHGMAVSVLEEDETDRAAIRRGEAFFEKSVAARAFVAAAGPIANFVLAAVLLSGLFATYGRQVALPVVSEVMKDSAADHAGLQPGDVITSVDGAHVVYFEQLRSIIASEPNRTVKLGVRRGAAELAVPIHIGAATEDGVLVGKIGVGSGANEMQPLGLLPAIGAGLSETWFVLWQTLLGLVRLVTTGNGVHELGGPIKIAQLAGQQAQLGFSSLLNFIALLSVNLGLVNLLPIPILDGGHLVFYAAEALRGRPLPARAQDYGYRIGFAIIASIFVVISFNDLVRAGAFSWVGHLVGS
jgi:regulator of sigma E protease